MSLRSESALEAAPQPVGVIRPATQDVATSGLTSAPQGTPEPTAQRALVLVVDDDTVSARLVERSLQLMGYEVLTFASAEAMLTQLPQLKPAAICLDIVLPGLSGIQALPLIREQHPTASVLMVSSETGIDGIVGTIKSGAVDYVLKPVEREMLAQRVSLAVAQHHVRKQVAGLERSLEAIGFGRWVGGAEDMRRLLRSVEHAARGQLHVLIRCERIEPRVAIARAIHAASSRRAAPTIELDAADLGQSAKVRSVLAGLVANPSNDPANVAILGGTVFVDRLEALKKEDQDLLLAALRVVHGTDPSTRALGLRVIGGSAHDLLAEVEQGRFSAELLRYLSSHQLVVPAPSEAHSGPGDVKSLTEQVMTLDDLERHAIEAALKRTRGNVTRAMRQLGIGRTTLYRKLKKYGIR